MATKKAASKAPAKKSSQQKSSASSKKPATKTPRAAADPKHNTQSAPVSQETPKKDEPAKSKIDSPESNPSLREQGPHGEAARDSSTTPGPKETNRDPAIQASPDSSPRRKGPLAPGAEPHGQREPDDLDADLGIHPAVRALNVIRRHAAVKGSVRYETVAEVYDETGLDWRVWQETVRGV